MRTSKEVPKMLSLTNDMDTRWSRVEGIGAESGVGVELDRGSYLSQCAI